jgi:catechol 2,3-dioxygenase-like lactoylglutathione lyase family enzyme
LFDHVAIRPSDWSASEHFYRTVLTAIGDEPDVEREGFVRWEEFILVGTSDDRPPTQKVHIGFAAPNRDLVDAFWQAGTDAGYADDGAPGERSQYREDYYGAFLLDPDGNSVEAVHHGDAHARGCIDHLWIGVRDLGAAEAFYATISRYTGLRVGRRWEEGVQFRGALATFSLVADGREPTENLHLAFPAPDQQTVQEFHAAAVAAGYESNGEPGERPQYHPGYYAAFALDPDGNNIESVFHGASG